MWTLEQVVQSKNMRQVANLTYEVSVALYVTPRNIAALKSYNKVGNAVGVDLPEVDEVINGCKINRTNQVILVHNHPYFNGDCDASPSSEDISATFGFQQDLLKKGIQLIDHIIVCPKGCFSFKQNGLI